MACGLAIIATNVGAIAAMVSDKNGWLIKPACKIELEAALIDAITTTKIIIKKETSLKLIQSTFNWDHVAKQTIDHLKKQN
jgi:glycosyltransferase involved in cell wall biosynthesis